MLSEKRSRDLYRKPELFSFQKSALEATKNSNRVAYYHDMGLGKTFTGSEKMMSLGNRYNLVICQRSKVGDWVAHFKRHYDICVYDCTAWKAKHWERVEDTFLNPKKIVYVINYELAWRRAGLLRLPPLTLLLDESSLIQNPTAKRTSFIFRLKINNVILLSGTPCSGRYENLVTQMNLLGWRISQDVFDSQYVNHRLIRVGSHFYKQIDEKNPYKNVERLKRKMREYGAHFLKTEECFDLPEQIFTDVKVKSNPLYSAFMRDSIVTAGEKTLVGNTSLSKRLYARYICAVHSESKAEALRDLLDSTNDRMIIFYNFTDEFKSLKELCKGRPTSFVNGSGKDLYAYERHGNSVTLIQYQAGAMGLNLQKANKIIFYSPTERCENYMQGMKRIHRIGQKRNCFYWRMICAGSVEEKIYSALERGVDYTDELFREDFR